MTFSGSIRHTWDLIWRIASRLDPPDIQCLESVQRAATKLVPCPRNLSYDKRGASTHIFIGQKRGDLIETFTILSVFSKVSSHQFYIVQWLLRVTADRNFALFGFCDLDRWPSYTTLTRMCGEWIYAACANMNFEPSSRLPTYTWPKLYTTPLRGWSKICNTACLDALRKWMLSDFHIRKLERKHLTKQVNSIKMAWLHLQLVTCWFSILTVQVLDTFVFCAVTFFYQSVTQLIGYCRFVHDWLG